MSFAHSPKIVTDGLVLALDAKNPKSYPGSGATWYDLSGYNNHGQILNQVSHNGEAFDFDGTSDYVNCGSDASLDLTSQMTLTVAVNASAMPGNMYVLTKQDYGNGYILHYDIAYETTPGGGFQTTNVTNTEFEFGTNIQQNNWYIVSYTYDGSTERAYYNGELINSKAKTGAISTNASYDLHIGYRGGGGWVGQIALVHIHNTALTTPEIQQNYNALKGRFGL